MCSTTLIPTQETKKTTGFTISLDTTYPCKNNQMLSQKEPAEELDENNQKRIHKIIGKFLYYARDIDTTMFMTLNSLVVVHTKPTIETSKHITKFLNYSATHPDAVKEYRKSVIILRIYIRMHPTSQNQMHETDQVDIFSWDQNPTHQYKQYPHKT